MVLPEVVSAEERLKARLSLLALVERSRLVTDAVATALTKLGAPAARRDDTLRGHSRALAQAREYPLVSRGGWLRIRSQPRGGAAPGTDGVARLVRSVRAATRSGMQLWPAPGDDGGRSGADLDVPLPRVPASDRERIRNAGTLAPRAGAY